MKQAWEMTQSQYLNCFYKVETEEFIRFEVFYPTRAAALSAGHIRITRTKPNLYQRGRRLELHRDEVEGALAAGKRVPERVLADYPDLNKRG